MSIKAPGSRFGSSVHMKGLHIGSKGNRKTLGFYLNLTPMIDMFTILVVFLLITFSASGEILMSSKDIELPLAYQSRPLERVPTVAITADWIVFEGEEVVKTGMVNEENMPDQKIGELSKRLKESQELYSNNNRPPADPEAKAEWLRKSQQIIIQADKKIPFEVIRLVMTTAANERYSSINFAINSKGDAPNPGEKKAE
ncbi:MAG TPA: biopolymer transporter ExbD [Myxococcota bacterium]|nr:biopolymer transporter ExbD [Myxococcota bacterium]HOD08717.1 biopolymer transporter ExbD [Myxococcota bacterium]